MIDGNVSPPNVYASDAGEAAPTVGAPAAPAFGVMYSVDLGENDQRQMSLGDVVTAYNEGTINAETYVWADGFADWTALAQVEEIVAALHAAAAQDSPTAPTDETSAAAASAAPSESPWDHSAPRVGAPSGGGVDLFGNVSGAGGEADQISSAPFGAPAQPAAHEGTGARNESSVLFSLSALTSGTSPSRPSVPVPAAASGGNDDSGLIDLKALTAAAEATAHVPAAVAVAPITSPLAASPLGGPLGVPGMGMGGMGGVGASIPPYQAKSNKNGLIIGGFLFAAIVAAAAIMTLGGGEEEKPVPPAVPAAAPTLEAPAPAPVPTASPELPTSDAKPPSTGTEEDPAAPAKPSGIAKPRPTPKPSGSSSTASPSPDPSPAPAAAPKPKTGKCGCKSDDLMCLMNCAQ